MDLNGGGDDLAVVTCADHNMLAAACCALLSVRDNISVPARLFLVTLDRSPEDEAAISNFNRRHHLNIEAIPFESDRLPNISRGRWPAAVLTRLFLDHIVPSGVKRLLYLDADTLVVSSIDALRRVGFMGKPVAAVDDFIMAFPKKLEARRVAIGLQQGNAYFNSGFMLFDWPKSLESKIFTDARDRLARFSDVYHATDQDALNATLAGKWVRLSPRWNAQTGFLPEISKPVIIHFTGRRKPWNANVAWIHRDYADKYRDYLAGTRWERGDHVPLFRKYTGMLLHFGKRIEGLRKSRRLRSYLNRTDRREVWKDGDE